MSRPARGLALLLATVLLLAPVLPFAAAGGAAAAPAGMSTIPAANVAADVPAGETIPLSASELEGGVMASQHADSLDVTLTTADHAASVMDADSAVVSGDGMVVVLRDDQQSAGREVALDAGLLQQALGYRPQAIYGTHEDGSEWTASAEYVDGYLVFDVPHFSSNTVTFSGEVTIDAAGATNGTQFTYQLTGNETISNASVELTGETNGRWNNVSQNGLVDGSSVSFDVGGTATPTGPSANREPTVTLSAAGPNGRDDVSTTLAPGSEAVSTHIDGNLEPTGPSSSNEPEVDILHNAGTSETVDLATGSEFYQPRSAGQYDDGEPAFLHYDPSTLTLERTNGQVIETYSGARGEGLGIDADGDGYKEVVWIQEDANRQLTVSDPRDGTSDTLGESVYNAPRGADVDGDGIDEITVPYDYDGTGGREPAYNDYHTGGGWSSTASHATGGTPGDFDGDGVEEVIYEVDLGSGFEPAIVDFEDDTTNTFSAPGDNYYNGPYTTTSDVNDDGYAEILMGTSTSPSSTIELSYYQPYTETTADSISFSNPQDDIRGHANLGDVNGDGSPEVVTSIYTQNTENAYRLYYYNNGATKIGDAQSQSYISSKFGAGDFDGDGANEWGAVWGTDFSYYNPAIDQISYEIDAGDDGSVEASGTAYSGTTRTVELPSLDASDDTVSITRSPSPSTEVEFRIRERSGGVDPRLDLNQDGLNEISYSGTIKDSKTFEAAGISAGSNTVDASLGAGEVDATFRIKEQTRTEDPSIRIDSSGGNQTVTHSGVVADGNTVDLSDSVDESLISGDTTVTVGVRNPPTGPDGSVSLLYSHSAQDQISTSYESSTFEESYNISHTYADATENAQVTIPFASSRVVSVGNVEYRVDGGSWSRVASANYRLDGTTLDVYLDDATGGVDAGQTVDVRATGRKIDVGNGAVTVTDPTAPGEELDTQLQIDSRSEDFHVNVGPTDDGDRVHYAYADNFPTEDYVVIDAAGNQQLYLPNAVQGDRFRVQHLDTRVVAEQGDVRIDVVEAGQNPELDVSPGPGGSGDPVRVEYYNTESGVTYLLNSLTRSIVVDSDTAQSPAIFEDDDSEDTWAILRDSGPSGSSGGGGGAVGQFRETASNTIGSISLPISGSGLGQLALVGVLGLGGVVVLRRLWPFGDDSDAVTGDTGTASESDAGLLTGVAMSLTSASQRAARTTGSGLLTALQRVLDYLGNVVSIILGNRRASIAAAVVAAIVAARVGLVQLPEGTGILIVVSGVPLATWLIMRRSDAVSRRVWLASTIAAVILGLEFVAPGTVQTAIEQLTSEQVAPLLILVGAGGLYLWYRARQSDRPQIIIGGNNE